MTTQIANLGDSAPLYSTRVSENFAAWLQASGTALAVTTYQIGKLFLIGAFVLLARGSGRKGRLHKGGGPVMSAPW